MALCPGRYDKQLKKYGTIIEWVQNQCEIDIEFCSREWRYNNNSTSRP